MKREDFIGEPCACGQCVQAGVSEYPIRRDPQTGRWLHGYDLRRAVEAEAQFWQRFRQLRETKAIR